MKEKEDMIYVSELENNEDPVIDGGFLSNDVKYKVKRELKKYAGSTSLMQSLIKVTYYTGLFEVVGYITKKEGEFYDGIDALNARCIARLEEMYKRYEA